MVKIIDLKGKGKYQSKYYLLKLFGMSVWALSLGCGIGWMRIFGKGIHWKKHRLYFSERNGYRKAINIGKWRLSLLR